MLVEEWGHSKPYQKFSDDAAVLLYRCQYTVGTTYPCRLKIKGLLRTTLLMLYIT
jgi:hypothetical protein